MDNKNQQVEEIRKAIHKVVAIGPDFLTHKIPADQMAHTMVNAVQDYTQNAKNNGALHPQTSEAEQLQRVLKELMGCGSGFLANRCDAACVARTITYMVNEFGKKEQA